jgi:hypothetical protein
MEIFGMHSEQELQETVLCESFKFNNDIPQFILVLLIHNEFICHRLQSVQKKKNQDGLKWVSNKILKDLNQK